MFNLGSIYETHHMFEICTKVLKARDNFKNVKLTRCQKLSMLTTNDL